MRFAPAGLKIRVLVVLLQFLMMAPLFLEASKDTAWLDGKRVHFKGYKNIFKYTRVKIIGNPANVTRIYFCIHGDGSADYSDSTAGDRRSMAAALERENPDEGAIVAYPVSLGSRWEGFDSGKNGQILLTMFRRLEKVTGNDNVKFQIFSLSGGGRVTHAFLRMINNGYAGNDDVREFVDSHLEGIHDGDSLCYSIPDMRANFITAIRSFPRVRFSFIHNTSGKMSYVQKHHNTIAKTIGNRSFPFGGSLSLRGGRIRFWSAPTHWTAWKGQFTKVFFGPVAAMLAAADVGESEDGE